MLAKIGQREIAIIVIVLSLLAAGIWYTTWYKGAQERIDQLETEIDKLELERRRGLAARKALPQLEAAIADYEAQINEFLRALPPKEDFANVLQSLSDRAKATGVVLKSIKRAPAGNPVEDVRAVNLSLSLESPFPELFVYLKELEDMRRFSTIDGLAMTIGSADAENPRLNTNLTMTVYVYEGKPPTGEDEGGAGQ